MSPSSLRYQPMEGTLTLTGLVDTRRGAISAGVFSEFNSPSWTPFFNGASGPVESFWAKSNGESSRVMSILVRVHDAEGG